MSYKPFRFKQFEIMHDKSAMKVGVDSVLLGSIIEFGSANRILDLGSGTGLLALMVAQKTKDAFITAVELDVGAFRESKENVELSPWFDRIEVINCDINDFTPTRKFDYIVSNPPYFQNSTKSPLAARNRARQNDGLSLIVFFSNINRLLSKEGKCTFIYPSQLKQEIFLLIEKYGLSLITIINVFPKRNKPQNRIICTVSFKKEKVFEQNIFIRGTDNKYTTQYLNITSEFYL